MLSKLDCKMLKDTIVPAGLTVAETAKLFGKNNKLFVYRRVKEGKLKLIKLSERSSLITMKSIKDYAKSIDLPLEI